MRNKTTKEENMDKRASKYTHVVGVPYLLAYLTIVLMATPVIHANGNPFELNSGYEKDMTYEGDISSDELPELKLRTEDEEILARTSGIPMELRVSFIRKARANERQSDPNLVVAQSLKVEFKKAYRQYFQLNSQNQPIKNKGGIFTSQKEYDIFCLMDYGGALGQTTSENVLKLFIKQRGTEKVLPIRGYPIIDAKVDKYPEPVEVRFQPIKSKRVQTKQDNLYITVVGPVAQWDEIEQDDSLSFKMATNIVHYAIMMYSNMWDNLILKGGYTMDPLNGQWTQMSLVKNQRISEIVKIGKYRRQVMKITGVHASLYAQLVYDSKDGNIDFDILKNSKKTLSFGKSRFNMARNENQDKRGVVGYLFRWPWNWFDSQGYRERLKSPHSVHITELMTFEVTKTFVIGQVDKGDQFTLRVEVVKIAKKEKKKLRDYNYRL